MKFPTGTTNEKNAGEEEREPTLQPSTESYHVILGAYYAKKFIVPTLLGESALMPLFINGTYKINGNGIHNYRIGDEVRFNIGTSYSLFRRLDLLAQFNFNYKAHDHRGDTDEETTDSGGRWLYFMPGGERTKVYRDRETLFHGAIKALFIALSVQILLKQYI